MSSTSTPTIRWRHRVQNAGFLLPPSRWAKAFHLQRGWQRPPISTQGPESPGKGPTAVSHSEGRTGQSCHQAPGCVSCHRIRSLLGPPPGLVDARCRTPLRATDEKLLEAGKRQTLHSLPQRRERSEARWARLAFVSRHIRTVWDASHKESEARFTLFWFRMRWFLLSFFFFLGRRALRNQESKYSESGRHLGARREI